MPVEIDETELRNLQASASAAGHLKNYETVFQALRKDPEARKMLHAAIKKVSPNTAIPEFDSQAAFHGAAQKLGESIEPRLKKIDEFIEGQQKKEIESNVNSRIERGHQFLRGQNMQKEGIEAVEKLMQERGIADYEAGYALFTRINPPEEMATPGAQSAMGLFTGDAPNAADEFKRWASGPKGREGDRAAHDEVRNVLKEIRRGTRAA